LTDVRIEIFKNPLFCDDHFYDGWENIYNNPSISKYPDKIDIIITSGEMQGYIGKNVDFNTSNYEWLLVRALSFSGSKWYIKIYSGGTEKAAWTFMEDGFYAINMRQIYEGDVDEIRVGFEGSESQILSLDYICVAEDWMAPSNSIKDLEVNDCLLEKGVSNCLFTVVDEADLSDRLTFGSRVLVWIAKSVGYIGNPSGKVFGGIINTKKQRKSAGSKLCEVECLGLGWQLQNPPRLITKYYDNINGRELIKDVLQESQVAITDVKVDSDNEIASTFTKNYEEKTPYKIIKEICKESKKADGTQGFDAWVDPAGNLWVFPREKYSQPNQIVSNKVISAERSVDAYRVKNRIKVFGGWGGYIPNTGDFCEENPLDPDHWNTIYGAISPQTDPVSCGNVSLGVVPEQDSQTGWWIARFIRWLFPYDKVTNEHSGFYGASGIYFKLYTSTTIHSVDVYLLCPDINNMVRINFNNEDGFPKGQWNEFSADLNPPFTATYGNPNLKNIKGIMFDFAESTYFNCLIDCLRFTGCRHHYTAEDSASQQAYGVRSKIVEDETLDSVEDCQLKAESLIGYLKNPTETIKVRHVAADLNLKPGWKYPLTLPEIGISTQTYYRLLNITHSVDEDMHWIIEATFNKEPLYIDKIFRKLYEMSG